MALQEIRRGRACQREDAERDPAAQGGHRQPHHSGPQPEPAWRRADGALRPLPCQAGGFPADPGWQALGPSGRPSSRHFLSSRRDSLPWGAACHWPHQTLLILANPQHGWTSLPGLCTTHSCMARIVLLPIYTISWRCGLLDEDG